MTSRNRLDLKKIFRYSLFLLLTIFSINCIIWDLVGEDISHVVYAKTYTAISREQTEVQREIEDEIARDTEWADYNNQAATLTAAAYQTILAAPSPTASPPSILKVDFPTHIPGNKETYLGKLYFQDADGDVNRITLDVVKAVNFEGADYDPGAYLISGDYTNGVYQIYIWCDGVQDVTLRARLYDQTGLSSNSVDFSFSCV